MIARLVAVALLVVALAGCAGGSSQEVPSTSGALTADPADIDAENGGLEGVVVDDTTLPVVGATVQLIPGEKSATTAADGRFSIGRIPPGDYTVHAIRLGYEAAAKRVTIVANEVAQVTFQLVPIAIAEPRSEVLGPFQGYMQCRMATPLSSGACGFVPVVGNTPVTTVWTNDKVLWDFGKFSAENWNAIAFESRWTPSSAATNAKMMQVFSYDKRPGTHWWADSGARDSPIQLVYVRGEDGPGGQIPSGTPKEHREPTMNHTLRTWITLPFAPTTKPVEVAYELRFQMMVTIFYDQAVPEMYTAFPDQ